MQRTRIRKLAAVASIILAIALSGCTAAQISQAGCLGSKENMHVTTAAGGQKVIHGKVRFSCTGVSLTSHSMTTQVQRQVAPGVWSNVGQQKLDARGSLSAGVTATFYTLSVYPCTNGVYRYWAKASGTGNGTTHSTAQEYSNAVTISTC